MRKYLLASVAALGLTAAAGGAQAAYFAPTDPSQGAGSAGAPKTNPEPGKIVVRVAGLVAVDMGIFNQTADKSAVSAAKNAPFTMGGYFRLYFGVDGRTTGGLIYGANSEMRTQFAGGQARGYASAATQIAGPSSNSGASLWFTRRAYGYIGGDSWGIVRLGQGDGPLSLFNGNSTGEFYDTGMWDGDVCDVIGTGCVNWFFPVIGNEYDSNKITYVSPKMGGFNIGVSFAPNGSALSGTGSGAASAGQNNNQATSTVTSDVSRATNIFEIAARYQGNLGPVGVDGMVGYTAASTVKAAGAALPAGGVTSYKPISTFDVGLALTVAGFQPFFHLTSGKENGVSTPLPVLASGRKKDLMAWTVGAAYGQGPWIVGVGYLSQQSQGSNAGTGNLTETGINLGGNYTVTPGFDLFAEVIQGTKKQAGVNFRDGAAGLATNDNKSNASAFLLTGLWRW